MCIQGDDAGNMICVAGKASDDEEGQLKLAGVVAMPRGKKEDKTIKGPNDTLVDAEGKAKTFWPLGADNGLASTPQVNAEGKWAADALKKDAVMKVSWMQPKDAKTYTIPRYVSGDKISSFATPFTPVAEGEESKGVVCMTGVSLSGAVTLAAASLTVAAIALF